MSFANYFLKLLTIIQMNVTVDLTMYKNSKFHGFFQLNFWLID